MQKIDAEIRRILDEQYALTIKLLQENREKVEAMVTALMEFETIDADQINDIMAGVPARQPKASGDTKPPTSTKPGGGAQPKANPDSSATNPA
jgi:cell division protease FtsH